MAVGHKIQERRVWRVKYYTWAVYVNGKKKGRGLAFTRKRAEDRAIIMKYLVGDGT
jgi:hypothetical protein